MGVQYDKSLVLEEAHISILSDDLLLGQNKSQLAGCNRVQQVLRASNFGCLLGWESPRTQFSAAKS